MKRLLLLLVTIACIGFGDLAKAQMSPIQETRECELSQSELYSRTKRFIASVWESPSKVIQNDDKEGGVILVRSKIIKVQKQLLGIKCVYEYQFDVQFRMKDKKYRVEILNVECSDANQVGLGVTHKIPLIPPFEGENAPEKTKSSGKGISKKQAISMMAELKAELKSIPLLYIKEIDTPDDF